MPNPIAPTAEPALLPADVSARPTQAGMEAVARVLDGKSLEGRKAVKKVRRKSVSQDAPVDDGRGRHVDRTA